MDLPRLDAMNRYWARFPPLHTLAAAWMGIKPAGAAPKAPSEADIAELMQAFPPPP